MIVKIGKAGASFRGLGRYLTDEKERVAWTHSLNCANEDGPSVIHEMYTTFKDAEFLKQESGQHGGGTPLEKPVKHIALSWHVSEHPTKEQMIEATQSFLAEMGWDEHQALLVSHNDKKHAHVHLMLNRVHPETGLALKDGFEFRRAQSWALEYEREHGKILCEQRLLEPGERAPSPSRSTWERLKEFERDWERAEQQRPYDPSYLSREDRREVTHDHEWELLKERQKKEREDFFHVEGKQAFKQLRNEIIRNIRDDMRDDWRTYYEEKRAGADPEYLADQRLSLVVLQRQRIDWRIEDFGAELRELRDEQYKELLLRQKEERQELAERQERGLASPHLLERQTREPVLELTDELRPYEENRPRLIEDFQATAKETCAEEQGSANFFGEAAPEPMTPAENPRVRDGFDVAGDLGLGALGMLAAIGERLFDGFFGGSPPANQNQPPKPEPRREAPSGPDSPREQAIARAVEAASRAGENEQQAMRRDQEYWRERSRGD
jgi:hypothetical protein